jgi:hypothetical protein
MNMSPLKYLLIVALAFQASCSSAQPDEDPDSNQQDVFVEPIWTLDLEMQISETSGLISWDGVLWTHNDDTDTRLYLLDPSTAEIVGDYELPGVVNQDWEEISQDEQYIYVGDFGNNRGDRDNLSILRVEKSSLKSGSPSIDTIWFSYSDQPSLVSDGLNQTEFDCEAFVVSSDSIYLFSKQWLSGNTTRYVLPKVPGRHVAQKREVLNIQGLVTGASYLEEERLLVLCGYAGLSQPFLCIFSEYPHDDFFSGTHKRVNLSLPFHQVEAVCTSDGIHYYVSNERQSVNSYMNIPARMHFFDLEKVLEE